jgi:membrane dipeptidase
MHRRCLVFDGHVHALDREFYSGGSMGARKPDGYWDLPRAREGGVGAFFHSVYIPEQYYPGRFETKQVLRRVDHALQQLEANRDIVELACNGDELGRICAKGEMAAVLDIEGSYDLDGDLGVLRMLYRLGLRSAMLLRTTGTSITPRFWCKSRTGTQSVVFTSSIRSSLPTQPGRPARFPALLPWVRKACRS